MSYLLHHAAERASDMYAEEQLYSQGTTTGYTYPDPTRAVTQTFPHQQSLPISNPTSYNPYYPPWASNTNDVLDGDPLLPYHISPTGTGLGMSYQVPAPATVPEDNDDMLEDAGRYQPPRKRKSLSTDVDEGIYASHNNSTPPKRRSRRTHNPIAQEQLAPTAPTITPKTVSRHTQLQEKNNCRQKPEVRKGNGEMYVLIDGEWKPAVYHSKIRDKLIQRDAQKFGAPIWYQGMSLDYTSYSPLISSWTVDPASITDYQGLKVCFLRERPKRRNQDTESNYLDFDGRLIIDHNDRPIKEYPGAPLTISNQCPGHILEGLIRVFGMTYYDLMARMDLNKRYASGSRQMTYTCFTERTSRWRNRSNNGRKGDDKIVFPWHDRDKKDKSARSTVNTPSSLGDEDSQLSTEETEKTGRNNSYSALLSPNANIPKTNTNPGFDINTPSCPSNFTKQNIYPLSGISGRKEQTGGNSYSALPYPRANIPAPNTTTGFSTDTLGALSDFPPINQYQLYSPFAPPPAYSGEFPRHSAQIQQYNPHIYSNFGPGDLRNAYSQAPKALNTTVANPGCPEENTNFPFSIPKDNAFPNATDPATNTDFVLSDPEEDPFSGQTWDFSMAGRLPDLGFLPEFHPDEP